MGNRDVNYEDAPSGGMLSKVIASVASLTDLAQGPLWVARRAPPNRIVRS